MTRVLSELLGAREPEFRMGLMKLEAAHGRPSSDIRLTGDILRASRDKLKLLGLDPDDTTAQELYHALQQRMQADDAHLTKTLRTLAATYISAEGSVTAGMVHALKELPVDTNCYALKTSTMKTLIKKQPPKKAMKLLGYRSVESMLKHEQLASLLAAAWLIESASWRRGFVEQYKRLSPRDFETRHISFVAPSGSRWNKLTASLILTHKQTVVSLKELGAVVLLPLPAERPNGTVVATLALALHALNDLRATSSFLRLMQVRPDFGRQVATAVYGEPRLHLSLLGEGMPWHLLQRYYATAKHMYGTELFEPHLQADDFSWHSVERLLAHIEPKLDFWNDTAHLGVLEGKQAVSLNVLDVALNTCNKLPFLQRLTHYARTSLMHELMLRYLKHDAVEAAVTSELQPALQTEEVLL